MADAAPKEKKKRVVKKKPLVVIYKGDNVQVIDVTRDLESVLNMMQNDPSVKVHKVTL